jgi:hypothetical protein
VKQAEDSERYFNKVKKARQEKSASDKQEHNNNINNIYYRQNNFLLIPKQQSQHVQSSSVSASIQSLSSTAAPLSLSSKPTVQHTLNEYTNNPSKFNHNLLTLLEHNTTNDFDKINLGIEDIPSNHFVKSLTDFDLPLLN